MYICICIYVYLFFVSMVFLFLHLKTKLQLGLERIKFFAYKESFENWSKSLKSRYLLEKNLKFEYVVGESKLRSILIIGEYFYFDKYKVGHMDAKFLHFEGKRVI